MIRSVSREHMTPGVPLMGFVCETGQSRIVLDVGPCDVENVMIG